MEYEVDYSRMVEFRDASTGIFVRAKYGEHWDSYDIVHLTKESLLSWLKSRGGDNPYAENVVGVLLGHGNLHSA